MELRVGESCYRLANRIGRGAFGEIYKGTTYPYISSHSGINVKTDEEVAVKLVNIIPSIHSLL